MKRKLVGLESVDYIKKSTGERVQGVKLHCTGKSAEVAGTTVNTVWISAKSQGLMQIVSTLAVDDNLDIDFNNFGVVDNIEVIPAE